MPIVMETTEELYKELLLLLRKIGTFETEQKKESTHIVNR